MAKLHYYQHAGELNRELKRTIPSDRLKELHRKQPWRHFFIAGRQLLLMIGLPVLIYHVETAWVWAPASILLGFVVFGFTVLIHEALHKCVFNRDPHNVSEWLGIVYGVFSGLAYAQFNRWHLDHHNQLGSEVDDPKRAHLSPKRNARWYKLLYCTPMLFPIYFRAAAKEKCKYSDALNKSIARQRLVSVMFHLSVLGFFAWLSPWFALKAHVIPVFFVFPVAFTLNRLGQHYLIDPDDVAKWSTLIRPNPVWNFLFLFSSYHMEHHFFPGVPFYNLKALQKELDGFYKKRGVPTVTYTQLVKAWFWDNHVPHTKWLPKAERAQPIQEGLRQS